MFYGVYELYENTANYRRIKKCSKIEKFYI